MEDLKQVLRNFNTRGYSDPSAKYVSNDKGGKVLRLAEGDWEYEDEFYGGEPYSGNETLWVKGRPVFRSVYYGRVEKGVVFQPIYMFLREALALGPSGNGVHRGPESYVSGNLQYFNVCVGTIDDFEIRERITQDGKEIYSAVFIGGLVDVQKD